MSLPYNLPHLLRSAGLTVVEVDGWRGRGRMGLFDPVGVLNHHTGASARFWGRARELAYAKWMFLTGRPDLPAPLCQIALGYTGTVYIGASGRANHAGKAKASGTVTSGDGNALYIGVEWMLSGTEPIPKKMRKAAKILNAVLTHEVTKTSVKTISCHYETSVTGKWDIGDPSGIPFRGHRVLDTAKFRRQVQKKRDKIYRKKPPVPPQPKREKVKASVINIPAKIGKTDWETCFRKASKTTIFGINESLSKAQRDTYARLVRNSKPKLRKAGLRKTPNPIFWRKRRFALVSTKVHKIHGAAPGPLARRYPGFNAGRDINEVVLRQKSDGVEIAVLNFHFVPGGRKVAKAWRKVQRRLSKRLLRRLAKKHHKAGRVVILMGDANIYKPFKLPKGFRWLRGKGIDKIGANRSGTAKTFPAPTDHRHGVRATVWI